MVSELFRQEILITGATGFIGANLAHRLVRQGARPHITVRETSDLWRINSIKDKLRIHQLDLRLKEKTRELIRQIKPKVIFHCAAYGGYYYQQDKEEILSSNIEGTKNLLNSLTGVGFESFINTGSSSEYGIKDRPMAEGDELNPVNDYGRAKAESTLFCQRFAKEGKLPIVSLRLFSPYGYYEDNHRLIPSVVVSCLRGEDPELALPDSVRDYVFIDDVIDAMILSVEKKDRLSGEILNISFGRQYSVAEVAGAIIKLTGAGVKPKWKSIANPRREPSCWIGDISKARSMIGYNPKYGLDEGLARTISWFKKNLTFYTHESLQR